MILSCYYVIPSQIILLLQANSMLLQIVLVKIPKFFACSLSVSRRAHWVLKKRLYSLDTNFLEWTITNFVLLHQEYFSQLLSLDQMKLDSQYLIVSVGKKQLFRRKKGQLYCYPSYWTTWHFLLMEINYTFI